VCSRTAGSATVNRTHTYDLVCRHLVEDGLSTDGFVTDRFPLGQWRRAVARAEDRAGGVIRVGLDTSVPG
jgi:threonine dehydrogenase-like Zn-dependent dehydrogenase